MGKANIGCGNCFYAEHPHKIDPCINCFEFDRWIPQDIYQEDKLATSYSQMYSNVDKPKHYMLFEDKGIEVRDVIEKLVEKLQTGGKGLGHYSGMFISDYVQMMQYLMRFMDKNGQEDLKKAQWYLNKLIESYDK